MNGQSILIRIEQDAQVAAAALLKEAQEKAEAIRKASELRIEQERSAVMERARRDAMELDDRMQRMARLDARKKQLKAKREVLDEAFAKALAKLRAMPEAEARAFGLALLLRAAKGDETIVADGASAWCDQAFVGTANAALVKAGRPGNLALSPEKRPLGGGFVLLSGGMEVQCTFEAALEAKRMELEAEIASLLFEG